MTPQERALMEALENVQGSVRSRTAAKKVAEAMEDFNSIEEFSAEFQEKLQDSKFTKNVTFEQKLDLSQIELKETELGYFISNIIMLEDGYIPNRVLFHKGAMKVGYDTWKKEKSQLLVNNSHIGIQTDLVAGSIGAITDMKIEKFGNDKDKTRAIVEVFIDKDNPDGQYIVTKTKRMNEILKSQGKDYGFMSVSAEVSLKDISVEEFAGSLTFAAKGVEFTGLGFVFNPANVSSFGTVKDLSENDKKTESEKSPLFNLLFTETMTAKEKLEAEKLAAIKLAEKQADKSEAEKDTAKDKSADDNSKDTKEKSESAKDKSEKESEKESEKDKSESKDKEEDKEESKKEEKPEDKEEESEKDDSKEEDKALATLSAKVDKLTQLSEASVNAAESIKKDNEKLSAEITALRESLDNSEGDILSRTPSKGVQSDKLSVAQRISKYGPEKE